MLAVHFAPGGTTDLVRLLDRVRSLGVEGKVLQLLLWSAFHGDKLALLRTASQARHDVG